MPGNRIVRQFLEARANHLLRYDFAIISLSAGINSPERRK